MDYSALPGRLALVRETIESHRQIGGWSHQVRIVAVTKTHGPEAVRAAFAAGLDAVGENRVQEALTKMEPVRDVPVEWHLIGTVQRNKVRRIVGQFALVHTVDRKELVTEFARRIPDDAPQRVLIEVNCGGEPVKAGVVPERLPDLIDEVLGHENLRLDGLMTMAPFTDEADVQRRTFRVLRALRDEAATRGIDLPHLSMGMSNDFGVAVEEGATMVRLGTVLFGERTP